MSHGAVPWFEDAEAETLKEMMMNALQHLKTWNEHDGGQTSTYRTDKLWASQTARRLGGGAVGIIDLRDLSTGWSFQFHSSMPPSTQIGKYMYSLHVKHNPSLQNA